MFKPGRLGQFQILTDKEKFQVIWSLILFFYKLELQSENLCGTAVTSRLIYLSELILW